MNSCLKPQRSQKVWKEANKLTYNQGLNFKGQIRLTDLHYSCVLASGTVGTYFSSLSVHVAFLWVDLQADLQSHSTYLPLSQLLIWANHWSQLKRNNTDKKQKTSPEKQPCKRNSLKSLSWVEFKVSSLFAIFFNGCLKGAIKGVFYHNKGSDNLPAVSRLWVDGQLSKFGFILFWNLKIRVCGMWRLWGSHSRGAWQSSSSHLIPSCVPGWDEEDNCDMITR